MKEKIHQEGGRRIADLIKRLRDGLSELTPGQRRVAEFLLRTHPGAALLSAAKVAEGAGVSEATVVRLAMALGYTGYTDLQQEMRRDLGRTVHKLHAITEEPPGDGWLLPAVIRQEVANLQALADSVTEAEFSRALELLCSAGRIFVSGARSSWPLAEYFGYVFNHLLGNVKPVPPALPQVMADLSGVGPRDLMVVFTFPRYTAVTSDMAAFARERGARVLCFTDSTACPVAAVADLTLCCPIDTPHSWDSYTSVQALINGLISGVMRKDRERILASLQRIEETYTRFSVLHKP